MIEIIKEEVKEKIVYLDEISYCPYKIYACIFNNSIYKLSATEVGGYRFLPQDDSCYSINFDVYKNSKEVLRQAVKLTGKVYSFDNFEEYINWLGNMTTFTFQ